MRAVEPAEAGLIEAPDGVRIAYEIRLSSWTAPIT